MKCLQLSLLLLASVAGAADQQPVASQPDPDPEVTLLRPGAGPHQPLRFRARTGAGSTIDMTMSMSVQQFVGQTALPVTMIATQYTIATSVTNLTSDGDIEYAFQYTRAAVVPDPEVPPHILESMQQRLQTLVGLRVTGVISARGLVKSSRVEAPEGMSPDLQQYVTGIEQLLSHMTAPFPAEPIGVGASWRTKRTVDQGGMTVDQTTVYTLTAWDGEAVEIDVEITESSEPQAFVNDQMLPGKAAQLVSFSSTGQASLAIRLTGLFPTEATFELVNDHVMLVQDDFMKRQVRRHTETMRHMKEVAGLSAP